MTSGSAAPAPRLRPARGQGSREESEVRRSRFIAVVRRAESEGEAREVIAACRREWPDARHHCSAFVVAVPGAQAVERSNDDAEPAGMAGRPILEAIRASGLGDVVVVVTRYFGGVKLGTGGLARAYGQSAAAGLAAVARVRVVERTLCEVTAPVAEMGRIEADLRGRGEMVVGVDYGAAAGTLRLATADAARLADAVGSLSGGVATCIARGSVEIEQAVR